MATLQIFIFTLMTLCVQFRGSETTLSTKWSERNVAELTCDGMESYYDKEIHDEALKLSFKTRMYRVMSNMHSLQSLSTRYAGKSVNSMKDLKNACPSSMFKWKTGVFFAFGRNSTCTEKSSGPTRYKCTGNWKMKDSDKSYKNDGRTTYLWTDGMKYTLHLHCMANTLNWILSSREKTVEKAAKSHVLRLIKKVGFNPENAVVIPHDSCKN